MTTGQPDQGEGFLGIPGAIREFGQTLGRTLIVVMATGALASLGVLLIIAGVLALLGFGPGDVARLTPPGRAAAVAEFAVGGR